MSVNVGITSESGRGADIGKWLKWAAGMSRPPLALRQPASVAPPFDCLRGTLRQERRHCAAPPIQGARLFLLKTEKPQGQPALSSNVSKASAYRICGIKRGIGKFRSLLRKWVGGMTSYEECMGHAQECVRLAGLTDDLTVRDQILDLARGGAGVCYMRVRRG
jgi:hypothetical protein